MPRNAGYRLIRRSCLKQLGNDLVAEIPWIQPFISWPHGVPHLAESVPDKTPAPRLRYVPFVSYDSLREDVMLRSASSVTFGPFDYPAHLLFRDFIQRDDPGPEFVFY